MHSIHDPNSVTVDLAALAHNFRQLAALTPPGVRMMPIVKSDAYGHGMVRVSETLDECGAHFLGVAHFHDAVRLRAAGIRTPIAVLSGLGTREEACAAAAYEITPVLFDPESLRLLSEESAGAGLVSSYFIKVDTGMGRLGILPENLGEFIGEVNNLPGLRFLGIISHLSTADEEDDSFTLEQIGRFEGAVGQLRAMGIHAPLNCLSNSSAICRHPQASYGMVRTGIMLYGALPAAGFNPPVALRPVMSFSARVVQVRHMRDSTPISYGRTFYTRGPSRLAVLSAGYGEGLPRAMSNRGFVIVGGRKVPLMGTICMDLTICDITGIDDVKAGDEAVFLGSNGGSTITADEMGLWSGTISYEILCSIGLRNRRTYVK